MLEATFVAYIERFAILQKYYCHSVNVSIEKVCTRKIDT